jgi:hypothetical protein
MNAKLVEAARRIRAREITTLVDLPREAHARMAAPRETREALIEERLAAIDEAFADEDAGDIAMRALRSEAPPQARQEDFPTQAAFQLLLDQREAAEALQQDEEEEAPQAAPRAKAPKWNLVRVKELYKAVSGFLAKLRQGLAAFDAPLCPGAPVSLTARAAIDGDVHFVVSVGKNAEDTHWAEAKRAAASWRKDSVGALVLVAAVLGKAAEIIASIVTFMAHPLQSVKEIFKALLALYKTLSDALELEA